MIMEGQQGFWKCYELYTDNSSHVMTHNQILQPCYDSQANTAAMLWQSNKYCSHVTTVKQILLPCYDSPTNTAAMLWQSNKYCSHVMTVKQTLQPYYDSQTYTAAMLWQSYKYSSHVITVKQILQPCYDSQTNTAAMLWQSSKFCFMKCCRNIHTCHSLQGIVYLVAYRQPCTALWRHTRELSSLFLKKTQINEGLLKQVCISVKLVT
jgi:hypothetical protein